MRSWDGDWLTEAVYFTSEADARKGESSTPEEGGNEMQEYSSLVEDLTYIDLKSPWLRSL